MGEWRRAGSTGLHNRINFMGPEMDGTRVTTAFVRIAFFVRSETREFQLAQARELKRRFGSELHLYCGDPQKTAFYRKRDTEGLFASINGSMVLLETAVEPVADEADLMRRANDLEHRLGTTINRLTVGNRHLGRGYALGAYNFPLSRFAIKSNHAQIVQAFVTTLAFWEKEFTDKRITLVINGQREAAAVARMMEIPYRSMIETRYRNTQTWMHDEFDYTPEIEAAFARDGLPETPGIDMPYESHIRLSAAIIPSTTFKGMVKKVAYLTARQIYWRLRGFWKARSYLYRENVRFVYRCWREFRRLRAMADGKLSDLAGRRFAYYPLHYEPERALQGISPEYFYQLSSITAVSRDLPAGVLLVVKDQFYGVAARPHDFYAQIKELKNVFMLDPLERGLEVVKAADVVVTICGTSGFEAAALGKPVIAFGRHNTYNFLPHVQTVTDEAVLPGLLRDALDGGGATERSRRDGRRFLNAIDACAFDMRGYTHVDLNSFDPASVVDSIDTLEHSLKPTNIAVRGQAMAATGDQAT
jgi:hypothetical protein